MWLYEKKLEYPVKAQSRDADLARYLLSAYGGPNGELTMSLQYLTQRYSMYVPEVKAILTDIGTEELAHLEMIAALIRKLVKNAPLEEIQAAGLGGYFVDHDRSVFYVDANGVPWTAAYVQSTGNPVADLQADMAAEQRARAMYENLFNMTDDPEVVDALKFLREREVVHFQRFGEALVIVQNSPPPIPPDDEMEEGS